MSRYPIKYVIWWRHRRPLKPQIGLHSFHFSNKKCLSQGHDKIVWGAINCGHLRWHKCCGMSACWNTHVITWHVSRLNYGTTSYLSIWQPFLLYLELCQHLVRPPRRLSKGQGFYKQILCPLIYYWVGYSNNSTGMCLKELDWSSLIVYIHKNRKKETTATTTTTAARRRWREGGGLGGRRSQ